MTVGAERERMLAELFAAVGRGAEIEPPFHCDYRWNIAVGDRFHAKLGCVILDCARPAASSRSPSASATTSASAAAR